MLLLPLSFRITFCVTLSEALLYFDLYELNYRSLIAFKNDFLFHNSNFFYQLLLIFFSI